MAEEEQEEPCNKDGGRLGQAKVANLKQQEIGGRRTETG